MNQNIPFQGLGQITKLPILTSHIDLSYSLSKNVIKKSFMIGMLNELQNLQSDLALAQLDGETSKYKGSAGNDLKWQRHQFVVATKLEYKKERWEISSYLPIKLQLIAYKDENLKLNRDNDKLLFNPVFKARYYLSSENFLAFNYEYQNIFGNILNIYQGPMLTNYRSLNTNSAELQQKNQHFAAVQFNGQRTIDMFFFNAGVNYRKISANTINSTIISEDITRSVLLPIENDSEVIGANLGLSKHISLFGSAANLNIFWNKTRSEQIFNGSRLPFSYSTILVNGNIGAELLKKFRLKYSANFLTFKSSSPTISLQSSAATDDITIRNFENALRFNWELGKSVNLSLNARHTYTTQPLYNDLNYLFADGSITYKIAKIKTDVELNLMNLTNEKTFETYSSSNNIFWNNRYQLRERMIMVKAIFNL